jgi:hypothetical protein
MTKVLVATHSGFRAFTDTGEGERELAGRRVGAVSAEVGGACLAVLDEKEIWRRDAGGAWAKVAKSEYLPAIDRFHWRGYFWRSNE